MKAGTVWPVALHVQERCRLGARAPAGAQQHPRPFRYPSVLAFPGDDALRHEEKIRILRHVRLGRDRQLIAARDRLDETWSVGNAERAQCAGPVIAVVQ